MDLRSRFRVVTAAVLLAGAGAAAAHDTWFETVPGAGWRLALGTGNQFPVQETGVGANYVVRQGCAGPRGALPLKALSNTDTALVFSAAVDATDCWAQLEPFEVTLAPALIDVYLREVNPTPANLAAWQDLAARGKPWVERYVKHARVVRAGATAAQPSGLGLDALLESTGPHVFRILRDGQPLPDFAVELRHERARVGVWQRTDAEGRVRFTPTLAGQWLLRGIDLRLSTARADTWDSRFVTLAFSVDQNGIKASPKARSTNQPAETAAMSAEPAANTAQR
jgi:hypothetical protein